MILQNYSNFKVKQKQKLINKRLPFPSTQFPFVVFLLVTVRSQSIRHWSAAAAAIAIALYGDRQPSSSSIVAVSRWGKCLFVAVFKEEEEEEVVESWFCSSCRLTFRRIYKPTTLLLTMHVISTRMDEGALALLMEQRSEWMMAEVAKEIEWRSRRSTDTLLLCMLVVVVICGPHWTRN